MTYRVFWNLHNRELGDWCIDTGPGSPRVWASSVTLICFAHTATTPRANEHPRGWIACAGTLVLHEDGSATIGP